jgi:hypothetical protein
LLTLSYRRPVQMIHSRFLELLRAQRLAKFRAPRSCNMLWKTHFTSTPSLRALL